MINILKAAGYTGLIIQITGEPGKGKTKMALSTGADYSETVLLNADAKRALVNQLLGAGVQFGYYWDALAGTANMKEIDRHMAYLQQFDLIEKLPPEKRRVIILDPWEYFEITLKPMVESNPKQFADYWSSAGTFKGAQQWQESHRYSAHLLSRLSGLCEMLFLTSHLRNAYKGGTRIPGKFQPDNKVAIIQKCDMRIWLRENAKSPVPIALMMKRGLMKAQVVDNKMQLVNVLPKRLEPQVGDRDVWDVMKRYWEEPADIRPPRDYEVPNEFEVSILEGTLTEDQKHAWELEVKMQAELELELEQDRNQEIKAMWEKDQNLEAIKEKFGLEAAEVLAIVMGG